MKHPARSCKRNSAVFVRRTTPFSSWLIRFQAGGILDVVTTLILQRFEAQKEVDIHAGY